MRRGRHEGPCGRRCGGTPSSSSTRLDSTVAREDSVGVTRADAAADCRQAEEYLRAGQHSLAIGDHNAAAGTATDVGINAAEAVAGNEPRSPMEGSARAGGAVRGRRRRRWTRCRQGASATAPTQDAVAMCAPCHPALPALQPDPEEHRTGTGPGRGRPPRVQVVVSLGREAGAREDEWPPRTRRGGDRRRAGPPPEEAGLTSAWNGPRSGLFVAAAAGSSIIRARCRRRGGRVRRAASRAPCRERAR